MSDEEEKETVTIWARVTKQERKAIEAIARDEDRSLAYVVARLLRERLATIGAQKEQVVA